MPFQPGQSGNPAGRPRGARNHTTVLFEQLIERDAETVIRTVIERAKSGDANALARLWGTMLPARKGRPVEVDLPRLERPSDAPRVIAAILRRRRQSQKRVKPHSRGSGGNIRPPRRFPPWCRLILRRRPTS